MNSDDLVPLLHTYLQQIHHVVIDTIDQRAEDEPVPALQIVALALELALDTLDGHILRADEVLKELTLTLRPIHTLAA